MCMEMAKKSASIKQTKRTAELFMMSPVHYCSSEVNVFGQKPNPCGLCSVRKEFS